jgi:hypothetical protein
MRIIAFFKKKLSWSKKQVLIKKNWKKSWHDNYDKSKNKKVINVKLLYEKFTKKK